MQTQQQYFEEQAKQWQSEEYAPLRAIAEALGFSLDVDQAFNSTVTLFRGSSVNDYFIILIKLRTGDWDIRIYRYEKKLIHQPQPGESDTIWRYMLFNGVVNATDEAAIRAILKATVPAK